MTKNIENRKKCVPFFNFQIKFNENLQNDEESLKQYISVFDLNPIVNNLVFQKVKEYQKYLYKYQYTLNYEDAKKLGCFSDVNENDLINCINNRIKQLRIKKFKVEKIDSLSKAKLMDFFFYLLLLEPLFCDYEGILKYIKSLRTNLDLIFKAPIYLGNNEIQYYFYYNIFLESFYYNIVEGQNKKNENKPQESKDIYLSSQLDYFPTIDNNFCSYGDIDLTDFMKRKQNLYNFINDNNKIYIEKIGETNNEKEINNIIELDEEGFGSEKKHYDDKKKNDKKQEFKIFRYKLDYFQKYKDVIIDTFCKIHEEKDIIDKIKYLYAFFLLELGKNKPPSLELINCFYLHNNEDEIRKLKKYDKELNPLLKVDYNKILYKNISPEGFFDDIENPFCDNYLAYTFPDFIHKTFIEYDNEIYCEFLEFLKFIYKSPLMQDIYYLCPEFIDFEYPFINDDILNEMFKNTNYIPCESKKYHGYTQKNLISIFIPNIIKISKIHRLELFIIKLGFLLNTTIHEQSKHYLKTLIFYNSFRYGKKNHIESDEDLENDENSYLKGLICKKGKKNNNLNGKDGGDRTEILLYGEVLKELTCLQGLKMFFKSTWNTSIDNNHFSDFINNYSKEISKKALKNSINYSDLKEIIEDGGEDVCPFFKRIIQKFLECNKMNKKKVPIELNYSAKKKSESSNNIIDTKIDINFEQTFERSNLKDYNP